MTADIEKVLLNEEELHQKVKELGAQISKDYAGKPLLVLGILKGSFIFMADLVREITIPCQVEFMAVSSYHSGVKTSGVVKIIKDIDINPKEYNILVVEDILDSGLTLSYLRDLLLRRGAVDLKIAVLLDKPSGRKTDIQADYCGFEVPDAFLVGYGLDYAEKYRTLPYVGILDPKVYSK
ncbi:hypoxanthine phosphoribosyltransferase [bacterium 1XD42-1]|nr:hypoxanthine phosphoribosyltransferase [Oscillospiraceae bacterium]RKJ57575.1 hypoxanthine phosphoribosyltransferase [bacterium 1XD42-8]RKJ65579.1 hypoxanthine phosphoribosyltransferase [bacterium 1XD42-1]